MKVRILEEGLLENKCYECEMPPVWNSKELTMRLDHINGINNDNRIENLRLICPNCDSQSDTYCGRNVKVLVSASPGRINQHTINPCPICSSPVSHHSKYCSRKCAGIGRSQDKLSVNELSLLQVNES